MNIISSFWCQGSVQSKVSSGNNKTKSIFLFSLLWAQTIEPKKEVGLSECQTTSTGWRGRFQHEQTGLELLNCPPVLKVQRNRVPIPITFVENIYTTRRGSFTTTLPVALWAAEKTYYNSTTQTCQPGKVCGDHTQEVWAVTQAVGCGIVKCGNIHNLRRLPRLLSLLTLNVDSCWCYDEDNNMPQGWENSKCHF